MVDQQLKVQASSDGYSFTESKGICQVEFCLGDIHTSGTRTDIIDLLKYSHLGAQRVQ
jgi:hypothetical protein